MLQFFIENWIPIAACWLFLVVLACLFMAGAKKASFTPAEIDAEYDQQYRDLNRVA